MEGTDQKQAGEIQHEGHGSIDYEDSWPDSDEVFHFEGWQLGGPDQEEVHNGAYRGVIVQADHGIHFLAIARKKDLGHCQTNCLESNCTDLAPKSDPLELNLAEAG